MIILGSGPNRIGQGIEFDYSCVHASFALRERGLRDRDGQLQPRDGLDRLRHLRPAVLRAADPRGRPRGRARRAAGRPGARRRRPARRADPARARAAAQGRRRADRRHQPRGDPPGRGPRRVRPGARRRRAARAQARHGHVVRRCAPASPTRSATRCWCARRTCSAVAAWRSSTTRSSSRATSREATEVSADHPVLVDRFLDDAIEIDVDALYDGDGALPRRRDGAHRGGRHPLRRLGLRAAADHARARGHRAGSARCTEALAARASACAACSTSSSRWPPTCSTSWRPTRAPRRTVPFVSKATGVPLAKAAARVMLGATIAELRAEGLLPATGDGGDCRTAPCAGRGQGGGAAVQPVPHRRGPRCRPHARAGDALHRRGDGHRRELRHRVREVPGGGLRRAADQGRRLRLGRQPRQAAHDLPGEAAGRPRLRDPRHRGHRGRAAPQRRRRDRRAQAQPRAAARRRADDRRPDPRGRGRHGRQHAVRPATPAADGYEIRAAAIAMDRPIITTVQELAAAVQGIEALRPGELGVRSLQDWNAALRSRGGGADDGAQHGRAAAGGRAGR